MHVAPHLCIWPSIRPSNRLLEPRQCLAGEISGLGGYALSNLHLRSEGLAKGLVLSLSVQNLFNKRYAHPGADSNWQNALEQDGRNLRFEVRQRF